MRVEHKQINNIKISLIEYSKCSPIKILQSPGRCKSSMHTLFDISGGILLILYRILVIKFGMIFSSEETFALK